MKPGQTVKHKFSGRIVKIETMDEIGVNPTTTRNGTTHEAFIDNLRPLTFLEKVVLILKF